MREPEQDKLLIHALWLLSLLYVHCEVVRQDAWDSSRSGTNFSFVQELTEGASSTIVVPGNHSVAGEFADLQTPIQLTRNVTLTGARGLDTVLDLAFLHGVVQLCASCVFTITNITIANERRGYGGLLDMFVGQPSGSSIISLHDVQRLRIACTAAAANAEVVKQTPRSKHVPGADRPQVPGVGDVTWNGHLSKSTLMNQDYTVDVPFKMEEGGHLEGGYALEAKRMRSLCEHTVSAACLAFKEPHACIDELTEHVLAARGAVLPGPPHHAAVVVPAVCAVLLAFGAVAFLLWWRHGRVTPDSSDTAAAAKVAAMDSLPLSLPSAMCSSTAEESWDVEKGLQQQHYSRPCSSKKEGWVLIHSLMSPALGTVQDCSAHFGELLGAGSFGRVYRGRWNGMEVAMKVIEHDASSAMEVENEVLLLMGLRHECIMAAYHCARYTRSNSAVPASPAATASAELSSMSSNGFLPSHSAAQQVPNGNTSKSSERDKPDKRARQRAESHLVMEFCDCGTLAHTVATLMSRQPQSSQQQQQQADHVMPLQVLLLLQDVARGLKAIHSRNIVHGDLNARNVLVRTTPATAAGLTAKLADFGLSRAMKQQQTHRTTQTCGTMSHMPPEVLKEGRMSPAMDIYAFGIMMWEVATGAAAFKELHYGCFYKPIVVEGLRPQVPPDMPVDYAALMQQCWAAKPSDRPTADQLLKAMDALVAARGSCTG